MPLMDKEVGAVETIDTVAEGPSFGSYLNTLLTERTLTPRDLAGQLGLDLSLVYKWLRGERTPRFNSGHADHIAEALELTPDERRTLYESQVRSLRERPAHRALSPSRSRYVGTGAPVESLFAERRVIPLSGYAPPPHTVRGSGMIPEGAVRGPKAALAAAVDILATAPPQQALDRTILMTWQGAGALDPFDPPFGRDWVYALRGALARGWEARQIWRLNRDIGRSVTLVKTMLDLLGAGGYESLYIPRHETLQTPYDMLIVPDHAAALFFATADGSTVDSALVTRDPDQIALLTAHFEALEKQAQKLIEVYRPSDATLFDEVLTQSETRVPGRLFVKYSLSVMTEPAEWSSENSFWAQRMRALGRSGESLRMMIEHRRERQITLLGNADSVDYRDISTMQAAQDIALHGWYQRNAEITPTKGAPVAERRAHLTNAINTLKRYPRYQLALLDEREANELRVTRETFWEILGEQRVLINTRSLDIENHPVDLNITLDEPGIVAAFVEHFESHWRHIAPEHRDKAWVIKWLEDRFNEIPATDE
jgi:transcriptional regulator with XRE-family HTH domain